MNVRSQKSKDYGEMIGAADASANIDEFMKMLVSEICPILFTPYDILDNFKIANKLYRTKSDSNSMTESAKHSKVAK